MSAFMLKYVYIFLLLNTENFSSFEWDLEKKNPDVIKRPDGTPNEE